MIISVDESDLDPASCPKEKLELGDIGEFVDAVDPSGIPPMELAVLAAALVLALDGIPKLGLVLELDGENSPERLDPSGG